MFDSEMQKIFDVHYFISKNLTPNSTDEQNNGLKAYLKTIMNLYANYYKEKNIYLELLKGNEIIFNNSISFTGKRDELFATSDSSIRHGTIRTIDNTKYIYVVGKTEVSNDYTLVCVYDLSSTVQKYSKLTNYLITISIVVSVILAMLLYVVLKKLIKPIKVLTDYTKRISNGYYNERVIIKGKDELAILAKSFNSMASSVQANVEEMKVIVKRKQQFIDNFAHELRSPLTSIYGYAEYIQKAKITEEDKYTSTNHIMTETKRLQQISEKLLSLALLKQDNIKSSIVSVQSIFEKSIKIIYKKALIKSIKINSTYEAEFIMGDEELLISLVTNLLDNAIKASDEGSKVSLSAYKKNKFIVLEVKDNGFGMDKEDINNITEPFYRVNKSRSRKDGGAGLGLALCMQIVNCHNAKISFDSILKKGTTVKVIFTTL